VFQTWSQPEEPGNPGRYRPNRHRILAEPGWSIVPDLCDGGFNARREGSAFAQLSFAAHPISVDLSSTCRSAPDDRVDREPDEYLEKCFFCAAKSKFVDFYRSCNARRHSFRKLARFD
jgi:hypothetical protein